LNTIVSTTLKVAKSKLKLEKKFKIKYTLKLNMQHTKEKQPISQKALGIM